MLTNSCSAFHLSPCSLSCFWASSTVVHLGCDFLLSLSVSGEPLHKTVGRKSFLVTVSFDQRGDTPNAFALAGYCTMFCIIAADCADFGAGNPITGVVSEEDNSRPLTQFRLGNRCSIHLSYRAVVARISASSKLYFTMLTTADLLGGITQNCAIAGRRPQPRHGKGAQNPPAWEALCDRSAFARRDRSARRQTCLGSSAGNGGCG